MSDAVRIVPGEAPRGRGRPRIGTKVPVVIPDDVLADIDASAAAHGGDRAAEVRARLATHGGHCDRVRGSKPCLLPAEPVIEGAKLVAIRCSRHPYRPA